MSVIGIPHWGLTTERFLDLGFFDFSENADFWNSPMAFEVWEGAQSTEASCGIQIDGFSVRTEPPGCIFDDFYDLGVFLAF